MSKHRTITIEIEDVERADDFNEKVLFRQRRDYHFPMSEESLDAPIILQNVDELLMNNGSFL